MHHHQYTERVPLGTLRSPMAASMNLGLESDTFAAPMLMSKVEMGIAEQHGLKANELCD